MNLRQLSERLGIGARTLRRYRRDYANQAPKCFDDLEAWREFIGKTKNYSAERTRPRDRNGAGSVAEDGNGEYSAAAERKERILKLRLGNEARRVALEQLRQETVTIDECVASLNKIKTATSIELLRLPAILSDQLMGRDARQIQETLDVALRSALLRLSRPEIYRD